MNRIERLTAILLLLQEQPRTSEQIARHFEVSRRTVLRDIQALSEMGVPVIAREGPGGGYSLPEDYRLAPLPLTAHEAFLLLLGLSGITRLADVPYAPARASLLAKLRALLPRQALPEVAELLAAVGVDVPERDQRAPFLEPLVTAAREGRWLRVSYQSAERASTQHWLPRQIYTQGGLWYCRAYAAERGADRTFRVDRIRSVAMPGAGFRPPALPQLPPYDDPAHPEVLATFTPRGVALAESEPHLGQRIERDPSGGGRLAVRCPPSELDWYARYFASLGREVDVHAPPALRRRLRQLGQHLLDHYGKR